MPPPERTAPGASNPPTSSPCQQCMETGKVASFCSAASVSTPNPAYCSRASSYDLTICCSLMAWCPPKRNVAIRGGHRQGRSVGGWAIHRSAWLKNHLVGRVPSDKLKHVPH